MTKVQSRRKELDLTQVQVADMSGISERHYQSIEAGCCDPSTTISINIAKALKSDVETLFGPERETA